MFYKLLNQTQSIVVLWSCTATFHTWRKHLWLVTLTETSCFKCLSLTEQQINRNHFSPCGKRNPFHAWITGGKLGIFPREARFVKLLVEWCVLPLCRFSSSPDFQAALLIPLFTKWWRPFYWTAQSVRAQRTSCFSNLCNLVLFSFMSPHCAGKKNKKKCFCNFGIFFRGIFYSFLQEVAERLMQAIMWAVSECIFSVCSDW